MQYPQHHDAYLPNWDGPFFPKNIDEVNAAYQRKDLSGTMLMDSFDTIPGYNTPVQAETTDTYQWHWVFDFKIGNSKKNRIAIAFPKGYLGKLDRSIAIYTRGSVTEENITELLEILRQKMSSFTLQDSTTYRRNNKPPGRPSY